MINLLFSLRRLVMYKTIVAFVFCWIFFVGTCSGIMRIGAVFASCCVVSATLTCYMAQGLAFITSRKRYIFANGTRVHMN